MKKYMKCKVCGFIGEENQIKTVCPACGAPHTAFQSYTYNINEKRLKILNMHIHPILVHFPQALAFLSLIFIIIAFLAKGTTSSNFIIVEKILSILIPITVFIAIEAGVFDAKTRFKKRFGSLLKQKILIGTIFLTSSIISALLINYEIFTALGKVSIVLLSLVGFLCSGLLGKIGGTLLESKLPD